MMFNNNNSNERKDVSTRGGIDLRNENAANPSMVSFDFWKSCISLRMHPMLPKDKQTEYKKFDYETTISSALTPQNAFILLKNINKVIIPAIEKNEKKFVGVPVGGDGIIGVGSGFKDGSEPYLAIFKKLDASTKKPEVGMFYHFKNNLLIEDYDSETGKYTTSAEASVTELELFAKVLETGIKAATNAETHSYRTVQDWYNTSLLNFVKKIAEKNGISTDYSGNRSNNTNIFGGSGYASDASNDIPDSDMEKISGEVNDINQFLND